MKNTKKVILIILVVMVLILTIDFILMFGLKKTPLFAININSNKDGVSNEYYGLGYKAIKCKNLNGNDSLKVGFYNMNYSCQNTTIDKENNNNDIIQLFGKKYNNLNEINESDIKDYLNVIAKILKEKTYTEFTDEDITLVVAYKFLVNGDSESLSKISEYVASVFGIDNFRLKEGTYKSPLDETVIISIEGNNAKSNLSGRGILGISNYYKSININGNEIIVNYDYKILKSFGLTEEENEYIYYGNTNIYLKYENNKLIVTKIIYSKKQ